jgi:hypothetical protein
LIVGTAGATTDQAFGKEGKGNQMFQPRITKARFVLGPFSAEDMTTIGNFMCDRIRRRIQSGVNVDDAPSRALGPGYQKAKIRRGLNPVRDWTWRGRTLRSLAVKSASENRVAIGFIDAQSDTIAHINNLRERAFGVSQEDRKSLREIVLATLRRARPVRFRKAA